MQGGAGFSLPNTGGKTAGATSWSWPSPKNVETPGTGFSLPKPEGRKIPAHGASRGNVSSATDVRQQLGEGHGGLIVLLNRGAQYHSVQRLHAQPAKQQRFRTHGVGIIPILAEVLHGFQHVGENLRLCGLHFRLPNAWTCTRGVP